MNDSTKMLEYTRLDEDGTTMDYQKYKINWSYTADWGARSLLGHLITEGFIPTELPEASYNDDGTVQSSFMSDRIEQSLLMNSKWRNDTEELLGLIQKVLNGEKELSVPMVVRDGENDDEWEETVKTFDEMFPGETMISDVEMRAVLSPSDVLSDAVARFVLPKDRITVNIVETPHHGDEKLEEISLPDISEINFNQ